MRGAALPRSAFRPNRPPRAGRPAWKVAEQFHRWLRKLDCACCGRPPGDEYDPIVVAHVDHAGKGTIDAKGASSKVSDRWAIPLRDSCHARQHRVGWKTFEQILPDGDAVELAFRYWREWPGRAAWEREQIAAIEQAAAALGRRSAR